MFLSEQDTVPLPLLRLSDHQNETQQERYKRLKAFSDMTGIRFLFVYRFDEHLRLRERKRSSQHRNVR